MTTWLESQFSLTGKKALVTGSSKGIGASIAIAMAQAGADIVLVGRSEDSLKSTHDAIQKIGKSVETLICDVQSRSEISVAFKEIDQLNVDIVVNNAGSISRAPAIEATLEEWDRIIDTNHQLGIPDFTTVCKADVTKRLWSNHKYRLIVVISRRNQCSRLHSK